MIEQLRIAELLCTRLCHDLTGPIGAVSNGAEFLAEEGFSLQNQAMDLIITSASAAVTRLQFYREAYGWVKNQGEASLSDKQKMAVDFFSEGKIALDWPDTHADASGVSASFKMVRLIFNLLILASGVLIRGGAISVRLSQQDGGKQAVITARGPGLKWDGETQKALTQPQGVGDLSPKNVQAYLTRLLVEELGGQLTSAMKDDEFIFTLAQHSAQSADT